MNDAPTEYAEANSVDVRETNILHASDVIYWLDGSTASTTAEMNRIDSPLSLQFSVKPRDVRVLERLGKTAFWRKTTDPMVSGRATDTDKTRPAETTFNVVGAAWDFSRRYNPANFDLDLGNGVGHTVVLYPSPHGVSVPPAGCVFGRLQTDTNENAVLWALLELSINISNTDTLVIRGQSDSEGNFMLPLKRVPPLPSGESEYEAALSVTASLNNSVDTAPDMSSYAAFNLESTSSASSFGAEVELAIVPGNRIRLQSANRSFLALEEP